MNYTDSFHSDIDRYKYIVSLLDILSSGIGGDRLDSIAELKRLEKTSFLEVIRDLLNDQDVEKRRVAVEALIATDPKNNIEFVLPLLNDPDPDVRAEVIYRINQAGVIAS